MTSQKNHGWKHPTMAVFQKFRKFVFHSGIYLFCIPALLLLTGCSGSKKKSPPAGPPFPDLPPGTEILPDEHYIFTAPVTFYRNSQAGEVYIKKSASQKPSRFYMNIAGIDLNGNFRLRSYRGTAHKIKGITDLRAEECFLFGKKQIEERLAPLEKWDCDHLIFSFQNRDRILKSIKQEHTEFSDWAGPFDLIPLSEHTLFALQILDETSDGKFIAYGMNASKRLNDGHILLTKNNKHQFRTVKRYGDFIVIQPTAKITESVKGAVIYTNTPKKFKSLFDD